MELFSFQLSPNATLGLHQIVQAIQQYDYQTSLQYHANMISQGNFSEISSFMPSLKVLIQSAYQMQVYVQWAPNGRSLSASHFYLLAVDI